MLKHSAIFLLLFCACTSNNKEETASEDKKAPVSFTPPKIESDEITDVVFSSFWKKFTQIIRDKNQTTFIAIALDSLDCGVENEHGLTALNKFMATNFSKLFDTALVNKFDKKDKVRFYDDSFNEEYEPAFLLQQLKKGKDTIKEVAIEISDAGDEPIEISLKFIETKNGYKFYGYDK